MHLRPAKQSHHRSDENRLAVFATAEKNYDDGNVPTRLYYVAYELVPVSDQRLWVVCLAENLADGGIIERTLGLGIVLQFEAVAEK
jgi:hypothetical protein